MKCLLILLFVCLFSSGIYADTTFVSGTIAGETWTLAGSPYVVEGDILVASLTIEPGAVVLFQGDYVFEVAGIITAIGTEQDLIEFNKVDTVSGWQGIFFNFTQPGSELKYCKIEHSSNSGIRIIDNAPIIENCKIINNNASHGGGINIEINSGDTLIIKNCTITNNTSLVHGGGIHAILNSGKLIFESDTIKYNIANPTNAAGNYVGGGIRVNGEVEFNNCLIEENKCFSLCTGWSCDVFSRGGGVYIGDGIASFRNCIVRGNVVQAAEGGSSGWETTSSFGGGIYLNTGVLNLTNCIINCDSSISLGSSAGRKPWGSGIFVKGGTAYIENCTIAYNNTHGIRRENGNVTIINSIFYFNNNGGTQISGTATATYTDVQGGFTGNGNIDDNPVFIGQPCGDLSIISPSPCIDAGNSSANYNDICFPPSLGNERNDMGAHGGPGACGWVDPITGIEDEIIGAVTQYYLEQNYPNPFNPSTSIKYAISSRQFVTLKVYDVLGNEVANLVNEEKPAGSYEVAFNGSELTSGIYFYKLQAGSFVETKKMILIK